jgi:hypothetical protein
MLSLFQISTTASWTSIAYTSWFGCSKYGGAPYDDSNPSMIFTPYGAFEGYKCDDDLRSPMTVLVFFWLYIILTAWVIMVRRLLNNPRSFLCMLWERGGLFLLLVGLEKEGRKRARKCGSKRKPCTRERVCACVCCVERESWKTVDFSLWLSNGVFC